MHMIHDVSDFHSFGSTAPDQTGDDGVCGFTCKVLRVETQQPVMAFQYHLEYV